MKNFKTTIAGIAGGLASIATGAKLLATDFAANWEAGIAAITMGVSMIYGFWHAADKKPVEAEEEKVD